MALTPEGTPYVESTDLVANYPAASLSLANRVDLVGVLPFANSAARATAIPSPTDGQFTYLQDTNSTEFYNGSAFQALAGGKILQVVRATDTTQRTTTSTSFVDVTGMSVTITPQKNTSAILILGTGRFRAESSTAVQTFGNVQITDSSNVAISGSEELLFGSESPENTFFPLSIFAYATPATTSAVTYKMRIKANSGVTVKIENNVATGQMYAIEVAA
jgi:hypothetical protein